MARRRKPPPRWSRPAAEGAAVMVALALAFAAGFAGFVVGRETAEDDEPAAAETSQTATEATTAEPETTETETETAPTTETNGDTPTETEGDGEEADGEAVFASAGCGSCHTFEPAGATGTIGPDLGQTELNEDEIAQTIRNGRGAMPSFEGRLSDAEIAAVAAYIDDAG